MDKKNDIAASTVSVYTYYDLLAVLCNYVNTLDSGYQRDLCKYVPPNFSEYVRKAANKFPGLSMKSTSSISGHTNLDRTLVSHIFELFKSGDLNDCALILGIISNIDTALPLDPNFKIFLEGRNCKVLEEEHGGVSESYFEFKALNCNTADQYGLILPKVYCEWSKESDRTLETVALDPLAFALKNYLWVRKHDQWQITNLYCDFRRAGFNKVMIKNERPFKVVSSPLSKQAHFIVTLDKDNKVFYTQYLSQNNGMLRARLQRVIDFAIGEKADIVMFPEMMGSSTCLQICRECISEWFSEWRPRLYLLPSWEHEENGTWYNTLYALDENGDCIFKYNKQHPFCFETKDETLDGGIKVSYFEPIHADGNVFVIHVPGIGRIGVVICADVFEEGYLYRLVKDLRITLLLYPVFTKGKDLMERILALTITYSCDVVLCNTCAAWDNILDLPEARAKNSAFDSEFLSVYYPTGHKNYKDADIIKMSVVDCQGSDCQGCCFVTNLAKEYKGKSYASQQIRLEEI